MNRAYEFDKDKIPEELAKDESVKKAVKKLDSMYLDKEERKIYENDLKRLRDYKAELKTAEIKGKEEEVKAAKLDVEKFLLDILDDETISIKTGLEIEEVRKPRD